MSIIDAFIFNDELDMLELRLNTLSDVVDQFVLVEAPTTFQGNPKPFVFMEHRGDKRFAPFIDRMVHMLMNRLPEYGTAWTREHAQRNAIRDGLSDCDPWDIILVSDVDEIPDPDAVALLERTGVPDHGQSIAFRQDLYCFTLNWRHTRDWYGTRAIRYRDLKEPQSLRQTQGPRYPGEPVIGAGGWSFSWMGGVAAIQAKARAFSHTEVSRPDYLDADHLAACILAGRSFVPGDGNEYVWQDIDDSYPPYLLEHLDTTYRAWRAPFVAYSELLP